MGIGKDSDDDDSDAHSDGRYRGVVKRTCNHVFKFNVLVTSYEIIAADVKELAEARRLYWPLAIGALASGAVAPFLGRTAG